MRWYGECDIAVESSGQLCRKHQNLPLTKRVAGACARVKVWSAPDEKGRRCSVQVDTAVTPVIEELLWALFMNRGKLTEAFIKTLAAELREMRLAHEDHHP